MIISEKQILQLIKFLNLAIDDRLTDAGYEHAEILLSQIEDQQTEELKEIN